MSNKKTKKYQTKLGETDDETGYVKPKQTTTESMSNDDIKNVLQDYTRVEANQLIKSDHVRYFVINPDKTTDFRIGGWVLKTDGFPDYIVLTNGKNNWSVQCTNTIFYKQNNQTEVIEKYKKSITLKNDKIEDLNVQLKEKKNENVILLEHNKMLQKEISQRDNKIQKLEETIKKLQKK